jgi:hypothetical protein
VSTGNFTLWRDIHPTLTHGSAEDLVFADEGKPGSDRTEILGYGRQSILDKQRGGDPDDDLKDASDPP